MDGKTGTALANLPHHSKPSTQQRSDQQRTKLLE